MKNHAFLIVAHAHPEILSICVKRLLAPNHFIYIHVDKKSVDFFNNPLIKELMLVPSVKFIENRLNVYWGGSSQIVMTINLMKEAFKEKDISYFHLISGQDLPLKSNSDFDALFENSDINYIDCFGGKVTYKIKQRYLLFRFANPFNQRSCNRSSFYNCFLRKLGGRIFRHLERLACVIQWTIVKLGINLRPPFEMKVYYGSGWWSLNYEAVDYMLSYLQQNPSYSRRFSYTSCCDEIFFQTLLMASKLKNSIPVNNSIISFNLYSILSSTMRYIDWEDTVRKLPVTLDISDLDKIEKSNALFMRKIDYKTSYELLCKLGYIIT